MRVMKYEITAEGKLSASQIIAIGNAELDKVMFHLTEMGSTSMEETKIFAGSFFPLQEVDTHRDYAKMNRKYLSARIVDGVVEFLTYTVGITKGGTTGFFDAVTIFATSEIKVSPTAFLENGEADLNDQRNYSITKLSTYRETTRLVESNGVVKNVRGFIGFLEDHDGRTIAKKLLEFRDRDQTAYRTTATASAQAHAFWTKNWAHPTADSVAGNGRNWSNQGEQIKGGQKTIQKLGGK